MLLQRKNVSFLDLDASRVFCQPIILAMLLQRKHQTIVMHLACWLCFVNQSLQCCYKENITRSSCMHLECLLCFVNPSLQCCYKWKASEFSLFMHLACLLCFVNPSSLQCCYKENPSLQCCYKENIRPEHGIPDFWCPFLVIKPVFVPAWTK